MSDSLLTETTTIQADFFENHSELLEDLVQNGQHPQALFIGCADSRVTPETTLGAKPGDFFMLRNIANIIPPYTQVDIAIASLLEYAVQILQVPHIVVCGHTDCGGIYGLDKNIDIAAHPGLSRWLTLARPAQSEVDRTAHNLSPAERHLAIVERNVLLQLSHLTSYPYIRRRLEADELELHGWVYDLHAQHISHYNPTTEKFVVGDWSI